MDELLDWIGLSTFFAKLKTLFVTTESQLQKNYQKVMLKKGETYVAPYTFADQVSFSDGDTFQNKYDSGELTGPQGPKGDTGAKGDTGENGAKGDTGATPIISATASVDANIGTPSVSVTKSGSNEAPAFTFSFKNLKGATGVQGPKGETGAQGPQGEKGATGAAGTPGSVWYQGTAITGTSTSDTIFSGSGIANARVNDKYLNTSTGYVYNCTTAGAASVAKWRYVGSIKGATGSQGPKGDTGATGPQGATGATPVISATATVDANVGTPSVTVTKSGTTASPSFAFAFKNLKGATGSKGDPGSAGTRGSIWYRGTAITGTSTTPTIFSGSGVSSALVNDMYLNTSTGYVYTCTLAGSPTVAKWVYSGSIKGPTGAKGADGLTTSVTVNGTKYTQSNGNVTLPNYPTSLKNPNALTISLNGTSQGGYDGSAAKSINITAPSVGAISKWAVQLTNEDLNDIKVDIGFYYGAGGNTVANTPKDGSAFGLRCERTAGGYYLQTYTVNYNAKQYQRFFDGSNAKWSNWLKVYSEAQKPTLAEIGAAATTHTHNYAGASTPGGAANSASKLATPRKIAGISFDGTADISIPYANLTGKPTIPEGVEVIDSLESTNKTASLSANMGKQLNDTKTGLLNLLDNSDFTNPVNQRRQVDYLTKGACIDRWKIWDNNNQQALSVGSEGIFLKGQLYQILPNRTAPVGETYTFSVGIKGRDVISITGIETQKRFDDVLLTIGKDTSGTYTQVTIDTTNNNLVFLWAKLEKGSLFTQYQPKGYGRELAECIRYYQAIIFNIRGEGYDVGNGEKFFATLYHYPMRIKPTVILSATSYWGGFTNLNVSEIATTTDCRTIQITVDCKSGTSGGSVTSTATLNAEL